MKVDFSDDDLVLIEKCLIRRCQDLEAVYKRSINGMPDYAKDVALILVQYLFLIWKIRPDFTFLTESESLRSFIDESRTDVL